MQNRCLARQSVAALLTLWLISGAGRCEAQPATPLAPAPMSVTALDWQPLPDLPDSLGVAGPFVGVHKDVLIVAGGANFPTPVWETTKTWRDAIYVLRLSPSGYVWQQGGVLPRPIGYGATVSTPEGVLCLGGNDSRGTYRDTFLLSWNPAQQTITQSTCPPLPKPCANGQAVLIGNVVYLAGGQSGDTLDTALCNLWSLDLSQRDNPSTFVWRELAGWPGPPRAFHITAAQNNGSEECLYVVSGRCQLEGEVRFLRDVWEYTPRTGTWRQRAEMPRAMAAGPGIGFPQGCLLVLGGDDGALFHKADQLRDQHPGFEREVLLYDAVHDQWRSLGASPQNHVTTTPVLWNGRVILASGEVRPRVRTAKVWSIAPQVATDR